MSTVALTNSIEEKRTLYKRYWLHQQLKKRGISFSSEFRTVYLPFSTLDVDKNVLRLQNEYGYSVQYEIT